MCSVILSEILVWKRKKKENNEKRKININKNNNIGYVVVAGWLADGYVCVCAIFYKKTFVQIQVIYVLMETIVAWTHQIQYKDFQYLPIHLFGLWQSNLLQIEFILHVIKWKSAKIGEKKRRRRRRKCRTIEAIKVSNKCQIILKICKCT